MQVALVLVALCGARARADLPNSLAPRALLPSRMHVAVNESTDLRVVSSILTPNKTERWPESEIGWFFQRSDGRQTNRDTLAPSVPGGDFATVALPQAGVTMIGVQFKPLVVTLDAKQLDELRQRHARQSDEKDAAPPLGTNGGRIRVQSAAVAVVRARSDDPSADEASAVATSKCGQKTELRPMLDPTRLRVGDELPVRVYADGDKAPGARVRTLSPDGKESIRFAGPAGFATIAITMPGVWRVEAERMMPARDDPDADWVYYCGCLTFETADAADTAPGGTR